MGMKLSNYVKDTDNMKLKEEEIDKLLRKIIPKEYLKGNEEMEKIKVELLPEIPEDSL